MEPKFTVRTKIRRPLAEVFDAVYNPTKIAGYFATGGASGPLDVGKTVLWTFNDNPANPVTVPVKVQGMTRNQSIRFQWSASEGEYNPKTGEYPHPAGYDNTVEITFEALGPSETLVTIVEGTWRATPEGLKASYGNCQGWTAMSCFLKAYLEHGINLRQGAY